MVATHRIFIAFAVEDTTLRDFLVGQARNKSSPFEFVDMSVKDPWDSEWKTRCRTRIKGCDGVIGIITNNTANANGQIWELGCAIDEKIPLLLIYGYPEAQKRPWTLPAPISGRTVKDWTWDNISNFLDRL